MKLASSISYCLDNPWVYRAWQYPFVLQKLRPLFNSNDMKTVHRVLDVGCGPGTNAQFFAGCNYLGVDLNPKYIGFAEKRYGKKFLVADVTKSFSSTNEKFDFILMNSLLHHIDDKGVEEMFSHVKELLTPEGFVHVIDHLIPPPKTLARFLTDRDRGKHMRSSTQWSSLLSKYFSQNLWENFDLKVGSLTCWEMFYFRGKIR